MAGFHDKCPSLLSHLATHLTIIALDRQLDIFNSTFLVMAPKLICLVIECSTLWLLSAAMTKKDYVTRKLSPFSLGVSLSCTVT